MTATTSNTKDRILLLLAKEKDLATLDRWLEFMMDTAQPETMEDQNLSKTVVDTIRKIQTFAILESDWDSYGAEKIKTENIEKAIEWVKQLSQFPINEAFPTRNGGVQLEINHEKINCEIIFETEVKMLVYDDESDLQEEIIVSDVKKLIALIRNLHNKSSICEEFLID
jgi:hypothetical protein